MRHISDSTIIRESYAQYVQDESRLSGEAVTHLYFPETVAEVRDVVLSVSARNEQLVISGARTGVVGGAVPVESDNALSLESLRGQITVGFDGAWYARMPANITLAELDQHLTSVTAIHDEHGQDIPLPVEGLFYPVDPTEQTASIGGTVATNASGAQSYYYGATRAWVRALEVVLADGRCVTLRRGTGDVHDGVIHVDEDVCVPLTPITLPATKHTGCYYLRSDMDALDLFIGSEGTLDIITSVEVRLIARPAYMLALMLFFPERTPFEKMITALWSQKNGRVLAIECYDYNALNLMREGLSRDPGSRGIAIPSYAQYALFIEQCYADDAELDTVYAWYESQLKACGLTLERSWAGFDGHTLEQMKTLRHVVPEEINRIISERKRICPALYKVSTDMAVPKEVFFSLYDYYEQTLKAAGCDYALFGHAGDGHVHVNILPHTTDELHKAQVLCTQFAQKVVDLKGSISAEHGIGRLKKPLYTLQYTTRDRQIMHMIKKQLDPHVILNPGILCDVGV